VGGRSFFFAGGGTGGHIYPAIAVAEQIVKLEPTAKIHFFVSTRDIDKQILSETGFETIVLPAKGFSIRPDKLIGFCTSFLKSYRTAKRAIAESEKPIVIGVGGFIAAPVCFAAHKLKVPIVLLNVDIVPGRANKIIGHWADEIFVQFEETRQYFAKRKASVNTVGCPLRTGFDVCIPYPYHKDRHQYLNAGKLVEAGAAVIVDDLPDKKERPERLWKELQELMNDGKRREEMRQACKSIARLGASLKITEKLVKIANSG